MPFPLYPLLFAVYPVLYLYSVNLDETDVMEILLPLIYCLGGASAIYGVLGISLKDIQKAAFVTALALFFFFAYGQIWELHSEFKNVLGIGLSKDKVLLIESIICALGLIYVWRAQKSLEPLTRFLNFFSMALIGFSLLTIGSFHFNKAMHFVKRKQTLNQTQAQLAPILHGQRPDVYYLIFDAYPRADIIKRLLNGNNDAFIQSLEKRGFHIPKKSCSNYPRTFLSLSSSLNFQYVNYLGKANRDKGDDYSAYTDMLDDYELQKFLKNRGYKYIHVGSWSPPFKKNVHADTNFMGPADEFSLEFFQTTVLSKFLKDEMYYTQLRKHILKSLDQLENEVPKLPGPKFVFSHIICPHPPFHFDRNGNPVSVDPYSKDKVLLKSAFNDQLIYLNNRILSAIDQILMHSKTPPIIIIQGDHGTPLTGNLTDGWTPSYIVERLSILNAYYLPENGPDNKLRILYPTITPVNSWRRVLNYYFQTHYETLPDSQYFIHPKRPYIFYDMSGKGDCSVN